jgi:hypothetical protein
MKWLEMVCRCVYGRGQENQPAAKEKSSGWR